MKKLFTFLVISLLSGCAGSPNPEDLANYAFIRSGSTNFFLATGAGFTVGLVAIDGKPIEKINGLYRVAPGEHVVLMKCSGDENEFNQIFAVGEIYEFAVGYNGDNQCSGTLFKVE